MKLKIDFIPREQKVYEILKAFKKEKKNYKYFPWLLCREYIILHAHKEKNLSSGYFKGPGKK
jgi:hypothetical protein